MRKPISLFIQVILLTSSAAMAQAPSADWIIEKVDENIVSGNKIFVIEMTIHGRRGSRTIKSKSWISGTEQAFTEYLSPARERGTKMLKLGEQLWTYYPSTDRVIRISGHMLRQSLMGSDLSYEDMMEDPELQKLYLAQVSGEENYLERPCWVLDLSARKGDVAYHSRKIWVDKERFVVLKENRYARSGKLLKTTEVKSVIRVENRWVQNIIVFKDVLKKGKGTEFVIESVEFDVDIPGHIFSKAALRK